MTELPIVAHRSRASVIGWQVFLGAWVAVGASLILAGFLMESFGLSGLPLFVPGVLLLVIFGAFFMLARARLTDPAPIITLTKDAFHDHRLGDPIPWAEIRSLRRHKPGMRTFLQIEVDEPQRFLTNAGILTKPMLSLNPAMGFTAISTALNGLDVPQEALAEAAEAALAATR